MRFEYSYLSENLIEQYSPLLRRAYPDQFFFFYPERLKWLPRDNGELPVLIARQGSRIAAWMWLQKSAVFVHDSILEDAFFSVNTFTIPEFRRLGIGTHLQNMAASKHSLLWSISMSTQNRRNREHLGWGSGEPLRVYCLRVGKFDRTKLFSGFFDYCKRKHLYALSVILRLADALGMGAFSHLVINLHYPRWKYCNLRNDLFFKVVSLYDEEWDNLFLRIRRRYNFGVNRNAAWMNWNYVSQPHLHFFRYAVYCDGKLIGTVVFRAFEPGELPHGIITELLLDVKEDDSVYFDVLQFAIEKLSMLQCQYVYFGTSEAKYQKILQRIGFRCTDHLVPMCHYQSDTGEPLPLPKDKWLLSMGDQDIAQYCVSRHPSAKLMLTKLLQNSFLSRCRGKNSCTVGE